MKGVVFTFYDSENWSYFNTWYPVFQRTFPGWKATFYTDLWSSLTATQKTQMLAAQTLGIEIGNHSASSVDTPTYLLTHTEEEYWTNEVLLQQNNMIAGGVTAPTSFAIPSGEAPRTLIDLIISKGTAIKLVNKKTAGIFDDPTKSNGYYKSIYPKGLGGIGHEDTNSDVQRSCFDINYILEQLEYCKNNNDVYIHSGHKINDVQISTLTNLVSTIATISKYCICNGMSFYTMNDLVQAGFVGTERVIPYFSMITVTGTQSSGNDLTAVVQFHQENDVAESGSTYQWYRADDNIGTNSSAIGGATSLVYTLTGADTNKYVRIGCIPRTAIETGYETFTKWHAIT